MGIPCCLSAKGGGEMTIREKINASVETVRASSLCRIHLWKEGVFWVAYEQSAYAIWLSKKYKPSKKFIKSVDMEVVSIGFPKMALASLVEFHICSDEKRIDKHIVLETNSVVDETAFLKWKNAIPCRDVARKVSTIKQIEILAKIKNFDLFNATPVMCMNFLAEIKSEL